ncbi:MAG: hypothetical protein QY306_00870 [Anaerolineales bacterium]|nr:MAG: hypothetical protein QY306_00870 [Anaerolineales bacterium]
MATKKKSKTSTAKDKPKGKKTNLGDLRGHSGSKRQPALSAHKLKEIQNELVVPYKILRVTIGALGMGMPLILYTGGKLIFGFGVRESLSAYYHTDMRDVLVGILFALGVFLFSYKGYDRADNWAGYLACFFAIGVALFPTLPTEGSVTAIDERISAFHFFFAASFLLTLTYFALFQFTKSNKKRSEMSPLKRIRNTVYQTCGGIMLLCILLLAAYFFLQSGEGSFLGSSVPTFWLETLAIFAFGVSWFVKSEVILKDKEEAPTVEYVPQLVASPAKN